MKIKTSDLTYIEKNQLKCIMNSFLKEKTQAIPPNITDLLRLHSLVRKRKSFTILEFGTGYSTLILADALKKNEKDWLNLKTKPNIRNKHLFKLFCVDASKKWIKIAKQRVPRDLQKIINFSYSPVKIGLFNGQLCHFYQKLPNIVPDFIYLDAPDPKDVNGSINGLSFHNCPERTVMAADLLLMESTFLPGTFIIIDGRTNNARFLKNNFQRKYEFIWDKKGDVSTFELNEKRLGPHNFFGSDFLKH